MPTHLETLREKIDANDEKAYLKGLPTDAFAELDAQIRENNATRERLIVIHCLRMQRGEIEEQLKLDVGNVGLKAQLDEVRRRLSTLEHSVTEHIGRGAAESLGTAVGSAMTVFDSKAPALERAKSAGILGAIGLGLYGVWRWFHRKTVKTEIVGKEGKQEIVEQKESVPRYLLRITGLLALGTGLLWLLGRSKTQKELEEIKKEREPAPVAPL